jgi:hypothetical protein
MSITRGVATAAVVAGVAVTAASTAWADPPTMSGNYTLDFPGNPPTTYMVVFTPCGPGCTNAQIPNTPNYFDGQAHLSNAQWAMDVPDPHAIACADGSEHPGVHHDVWDANTLQGAQWATAPSNPCAGDAPGPLTTSPQKFTLTRV